jgi:hypothetical protein
VHVDSLRPVANSLPFSALSAVPTGPVTVNYSRVVAHELGHVLGLLHRGASQPNDGLVNPRENRMHDNAVVGGVDIDLIQARVIRESKALK